MPIYEYQCKECGVRFERTQRFSDEPVHVCPECSGDVQRLIQPAGIIFKGSGFYQTDYRSEEYRKRSREERSEKSSTDTKKPEKTSKAEGPDTKKKA